MKQLTIKTKCIKVGDNVRHGLVKDAVKQLAESIKEHGILQPLLVRPKGDDEFDLIAGHRRLMAAPIAGLIEVPVIVQDIDDDERTKVQLIENLQREDLNPVDEAIGYDALGMNVSMKDLVVITGKSLYHIKKVKALLNLCDDVKKLIQTGKLSGEHGYVLSRLQDAKSQKRLAAMIIKKKLSPAYAEQELEEFTFELAEAKFDKTICKTCAYNSEKLENLFDDDNFSGRARCLNAECFNKKKKELIESLKKELIEKGFKVHVMGDDENDRTPGDGNAFLDDYTFGDYFKLKAFKDECVSTCPTFVYYITKHGVAHPTCENVQCAKRKAKGIDRAKAAKKRGGKDTPGIESADDIQSQERKEALERKQMLRVDEYKRKFYIERISETMTDPQILRITAHQLMDHEAPCDHSISEYLGLPKKENFHMRSMKFLTGLDDVTLMQFIMNVCIGRLGRYATEEIVSLGKEAGNDIASGFEITEEYLQKFTKDGLANLINELKIPDCKLTATSKKSELVSAILAADINGKVPKEMLK